MRIRGGGETIQTIPAIGKEIVFFKKYDMKEGTILFDIYEITHKIEIERNGGWTDGGEDNRPYQIKGTPYSLTAWIGLRDLGFDNHNIRFEAKS